MASTIGARLHEARTARGLQLADIAATLRIKPEFLEALEAGQPERLPTATHASGFLRSYAQYLGVELTAPMRAPLTPPAPTLAPLAPVAGPRWVAIIPPLLVIGAILLLYALWHWLQPPPPAPIAPPPADFGQVSSQLLNKPLDTKPDAALVAPVPPAAPTALTEPAAPVVVQASEPTLASVDQPAEPVATPKEKPPVAVVSVQAAKPEPAGTQAPAPAIAANAAKPTIVVQAISDSWVQVTDANGKQLFSRLMRAGESWRAPSQSGAQSGLRLSTGNAGGVKVIYDGKSSGALGAPAQVVRNLPLDAALATQPAPTAKKATTPTTDDDFPFEDETQ